MNGMLDFLSVNVRPLLANSPQHKRKSPTLIEGGAFIVPAANYSGHFHSRISFLSIPFPCA